MKKIILLTLIFNLSGCAYFGNNRNNEEIQYYSLNAKTKAVVKKEDIYITKVTKVETLNNEIVDINTRFDGNFKPIASWDFSQKPSKNLQDEFVNKAIEFGANYIIIFEKKDCGNIDVKKNEIEKATGYNCYKILYFNLPIAKDGSYKNKKDELKESKNELKNVKELNIPMIPSATQIPNNSTEINQK